METPCISIAHQRGAAVEVTIGNLAVLFSYDTPVAYHNHRTGARARTPHQFSVTTSRHLSEYGAQEWERAGKTHEDFLHDLAIECDCANDTDR